MNNKKGNAGTIMIIMIFGFLVTVSTAYMELVQSETKVQSMMNHSDRALDSAFSGVQYAMAVAQSEQAMFKNNVSEVPNRIYFASSTHATDWDPGADNSTNPVDYPNVWDSDWFYYVGSFTYLSNMEIYNQTKKPYMFRVNTYASHSAALYPGEYIIKSQGKYIDYADANNTIVRNEYKAQIIAKVKIDFTRKILKLAGWRQMKYQSDAEFYGHDDVF
jgi:hypothetical protein